MFQLFIEIILLKFPVIAGCIYLPQTSLLFIFTSYSNLVFGDCSFSHIVIKVVNSGLPLREDPQSPAIDVPIPTTEKRQ